MKAAVIAGSPRAGSETAKVARHVAARWAALTGQAPFLLDLGRTALPPWRAPAGAPEEPWKSISATLHGADALVIVAPEWGGMAPGVLKNFFLLCERGELAHKPACLVGVSASAGGAYPLAELRMSSYKNTRICYIPEQIIVRNARRMLGAGRPLSGKDEALRARLDYALEILHAYAAALRDVRASGRADPARYPYGM